jgi:hypothetical protein
VAEAGDTEHQLAATARCITRDLGLGVQLVTLSPEAQATEHPLLAAFFEKRRESPQGQETVEGLQAKIVAYSLHTGRWRGLTWHEREVGIVWLLAGRYHRSGERDDSYPHFRALSKDQLLPTEADYERVFEKEAGAFAETVLDDVNALRTEAVEHPGEIASGRIGNRIATRVAYVDGTLQVALGMQLFPGDDPIPADWMIVVLAAFFPEVPFEALAWGHEIAGSKAAASEFVFSA